MTTKPNPRTLQEQIVSHLRTNLKDQLTLERINDLFNPPSVASIHSMMRREMEGDVVTRGRNEDGEYFYAAGPMLLVSKVPAVKPLPAAPKHSSDIDTGKLEICNDEVPGHRASREAKYGATFSQLKPGQCVKCEPNQVGALANALRKWIEVNDLPCMVASMRRFPQDQKGRVWMLANPKARQVSQLKAA